MAYGYGGNAYGMQYNGMQQSYTGYPQTSQNQYSGVYPNQQPTSMRADWVQGEPAARAYSNSPGMLTLLMDSEQPVLYVKMTDQSGRPMPLEVYDLVKRETYQSGQQMLPQWSGNNQKVEYVQQDMSDYVKKDELQNMVTDAVQKAMQQGGGQK